MLNSNDFHKTFFPEKLLIPLFDIVMFGKELYFLLSIYIKT